MVAALAANDRVKVHVHYDERGTAFAALGYARATGRPAAWVTTSGTAVANGLPAVVEAGTDNVPMVLLSADRPPELRQTGANQTVHQPGIFGCYVRWGFDVPAPDPHSDPASLLTLVDNAVHRARRAPSGPVHLNLMFREPLIPEPEENRGIKLPQHLSRWKSGDAPYTTYPKPETAPPETAEITERISPAERGVVVAGRLGSREEAEAAGELARRLGWPLFADVGSQARFGGEPENLVWNHDLVLLDKGFARRNRPEAVLQLGGGPVSKRLGRFIGESRPETHVVVREGPDRLDPAHIVTHRVESDVAVFCGRVMDGAGKRGGGGWLSGWLGAAGRVERTLHRVEKENGEELAEPFVARAVMRDMPSGSGLVVASSMPVRDVDSYAGLRADAEYIPVAANRGASGIDGTVATAAGFALGSGRAVTVLIGDLALLHDLNSLAMLRGLPVTFVVVNNDGGGIFSMLPVARHETFFERFFGTPHGLGFKDAARMFGLDYARPRTISEFRDAYSERSGSSGPGLIEVVTEREKSAALRQEISARVRVGIEEQP